MVPLALQATLGHSVVPHYAPIGHTVYTTCAGSVPNIPNMALWVDPSGQGILSGAHDMMWYHHITLYAHYVHTVGR